MTSLTSAFQKTSGKMFTRWVETITLVVSLLTIGVSTKVYAGAYRPCDVNFDPAPQTQQAIFDEFEGAVLRLKIAEEQGTAYLVDSSQGYAFTAAHVVKASLKGEAVRIIGTSVALPTIDLELKHVANLRYNGEGVDLVEGADIALLQVLDPTKVKHIRALDIALYKLRSGKQYYVMGYPGGATLPEIQKAEYLGPYKASRGKPVKGLLKFKQNITITGGESGSPLIDETGAVVGTLSRGILGTVGLYVPTAHAAKLLTEIPMTTRAKNFDDDFLSGSMFHAMLLQYLKRTSWKIRNIELFSWALHVEKSPKKYTDRKDYFYCPIKYAYSHRNLEGFGSFFEGLAKGPGLPARNVTARERDLRK